MSTISLQSSLRKLSDTGFCWPKRGQTYGFTDTATRTDSLVIFALAYGLTDQFFPDLRMSKLKRYLELRRLSDPEGIDIVGENSCLENVEAILLVRSFDPKKWKNGEYHKLTMTNVVSSNSLRKEKLNSFENVGIRCGCDRGLLQPSCRPPKGIRRMFGDYRDVKSAPGSFMDAIYCTHAEIGHDWLSIFYDVYGFGMHLPTTDSCRAINYVVKQVVEKNQKLPKYRLNLEFSPEKRDVFKPLADLAWRGQISPS